MPRNDLTDRQIWEIMGPTQCLSLTSKDFYRMAVLLGRRVRKFEGPQDTADFSQVMSLLQSRVHG